MRWLVIFSLTMSASFGSNAEAAKLCVHIFSSYKVTAKVQKHVTATVAALAELRLSLDVAQAQGRTSVEFAVLSNDYANKENEFVGYLEGHGIMTRNELKAKIKTAITALQNQKNIRNQNQEDTKKAEELIRRRQIIEMKDKTFDGSRILLNEVQPGFFKMGNLAEDKKDVQITRPFELMATLTTQKIWRTVVELAEKRLEFPFENQIADPSFFKGDPLPVENVSFFEIKKWIDSLNQLSKKGEPALFDLIQNFRPGDRFRLPTEAEWEFVIRGRGKLTTNFHFGNSWKALQDYAWIEDNSSKQTHAVAQKKPLIVDDKPFFDMHGNVMEFVADKYSDELPGGTDPFVNHTYNNDRVLRSGSWNFKADSNRSSSRRFYGEHIKRNDVGFRLVREVKP